MKTLFLLRMAARRLIPLLLATSGLATEAADNSAGYDIILLAGQSNMAGYSGPAPADDPDGVVHDAIKMWDPDKGIVPATDPIIHAKTGSGVGMGRSFAQSYLHWLRLNGNPNRKVLLVGAAFGGTGFKRDVPSENGEPALHHRWIATEDTTIGGDLYRGARDRANAAIATALKSDKPGDRPSNFVAILWHQGESDIAEPGGGAEYAQNHMKLVKALRANIQGAAGAPVVVGEMSPCRVNSCIEGQALPNTENIEAIMKYFHGINALVPRSAWVSSAGLVSVHNANHFDAVSQRELGRRYFTKFWEAREVLPSPVVELKSHNGKFFNIGTSIDADTSFPVPRRDGNLYVTGEVAAVPDDAHGNVAQISQGLGRLSLNASAELFNAGYTKMAWVKVNSTAFGNNVVSGIGPTQSHYLFTSSGVWSAGHSTTTARVNKFVQAQGKTPLGEWMHLALSYDAKLKQMDLYINGQRVDSATSVEAATPAYGILELEIPGRKEALSSGLDGSITSVRVYNTPLSAAQFKAIYAFERDAQTGYGRVLRPPPSPAK